MTSVLDTHVLLWLALEPKRLSRAARQRIVRSMRRGGLSIASITLWEIATLVSRGRLSIRGTPASWMSELLAQSGVGVLDLSPSIADLTTAFGPDFPQDPADRIIAATARCHGVPLITADERIHESTLVHCVW